MSISKICVRCIIVVAIAMSIGGFVKWRHRQARICVPVSLAEQLLHVSIPSLSCSDDFWEGTWVFLGKGKQCKVFEHRDGVHVIKVFYRKKRSKKAFGAALGGILATTEAPEETGVCLCGIGPNKKVRILTAKERIQHCSLRGRCILVQKKAASLKKAIVQAVDAGKLDEAQRYVQQVFIVLHALRSKHLLDCDGALVRNGNLGIHGGKVILLDTGRLCRYMQTGKHVLHDIHRLKPLRSWLQEIHPELVITFDQAQKDYCAHD